MTGKMEEARPRCVLRCAREAAGAGAARHVWLFIYPLSGIRAPRGRFIVHMLVT